MNKQLLLDNLRCIPDWPIKGVNFRDVTTLFKSPEALLEITNQMVDLYKDKGVTKIVGIEVISRSNPTWCRSGTMQEARKAPMRDRTRNLCKGIWYRYHRNP